MFTFAVSIQPGTESASNLQDVLNTYGNGYFMDSLYDLSSAPRRNAQRNHRLPGRRKRSGHQHEGMGQPATHQVRVRRRRLRTQFTTCAATPSAVGGCVPDAAGATGYPVIDYAKAAVTAIDGTGALHDPRYLGPAVWDFGDHVSWNGLNFGPVPAPADVLNYLTTNLPGAQNPGLARSPRT